MKVLACLDSKVPVKAWVDGVEFQNEAQEQFLNVSKLPFIFRHVAAMPDAHWGNGAAIGSVIPTVRAIIPAAVGVDLGCGMMAQRLSIRAEQLPDTLVHVRQAIEDAVPVGGPGIKGSWLETRRAIPLETIEAWSAMERDYEEICYIAPKIKRGATFEQLGTLGTGNHFIELCVDEEGYVWVMLHSGSRGLGNRIGCYYIDQAKREMEKWYITLPDANLAYLVEGSDYFRDYVRAVTFAQNYARVNRNLIMAAVLQALKGTLPSFGLHCAGELAINCHHNYVIMEHHFNADVWITRKGAVSAREGQLGIIPGSMGAKSFIVSGRGNADSFMSCSHGAGRRMSRNQARKEITIEQHRADTAGVECRKDATVLDESPAAYKDIDAVMHAQSDLVDIVHTLKQVLCVKG